MTVDTHGHLMREALIAHEGKLAVVAACVTCSYVRLRRALPSDAELPMIGGPLDAEPEPIEPIAA